MNKPGLHLCICFVHHSVEIISKIRHRVTGIVLLQHTGIHVRQRSYPEQSASWSNNSRTLQADQDNVSIGMQAVPGLCTQKCVFFYAGKGRTVTLPGVLG